MRQTSERLTLLKEARTSAGLIKQIITSVWESCHLAFLLHGGAAMLHAHLDVLLDWGVAPDALSCIVLQRVPQPYLHVTSLKC